MEIKKIKDYINYEKTNINIPIHNQSLKGTSSNNYNTKASNAEIEELDLSFSTSNNISSEDVISAVKENFEINRNITNKMNREVYANVKERINQFLANNRRDI